MPKQKLCCFARVYWSHVRQGIGPCVQGNVYSMVCPGFIWTRSPRGNGQVCVGVVVGRFYFRSIFGNTGAVAIGFTVMISHSSCCGL